MAEIPTGFCQCGCGGKTDIAWSTNPQFGAVRGQPNKFIHGHNRAHYKGGKTVNAQGYMMVRTPGHPKSHNGYVREHVLMAEKALGKPLPQGAIVHHVNGREADNTRGNHVICQDRAYHKLLHQRTRAFNACGHANWRKCRYCKRYSHPDKVTISGTAAYHKSCRNEKQRLWHHERKRRQNDSQSHAPSC